MIHFLDHQTNVSGKRAPDTQKLLLGNELRLIFLVEDTTLLETKAESGELKGAINKKLKLREYLLNGYEVCEIF